MKIREILDAIKLGLAVMVSVSKGKTSKVLRKTAEAAEIADAVERFVKKKK